MLTPQRINVTEVGPNGSQKATSCKAITVAMKAQDTTDVVVCSKQQTAGGIQWIKQSSFKGIFRGSPCIWTGKINTF